mgnify:FL=1|jgi:flagella basal body P-ring formation protein FlgA
MRITVFTLALFFSGLALGADARTTAAQIQQATETFLRSFAEQQAARGFDVHFQPGSLDSRLALAPCSQPLAVVFTGDPWKSSRPSLQVSCSGERPWRLFVTPSLTIHGPGLVARRPLARGEVLTPDLVTATTMVLNDSHRDILSEVGDVAGMVVRRPINPGVPITADLLEAPNAVSRGDHVIITARAGAFAVTSRGKALADAAVGEQVLVENLRSARTIKATVTGPGRVEVPM